MRRFYLEDGNGERLDLQQGSLFLHTPAGLGYAYGHEYTQAKNGFFARAEGEYAQPNIVGELVFMQNAYREYERVADWLHRAQDLKLVYCPTPERELLMDVDVESMELTELNRFGVLEAPISLRGKSPYYTREVVLFGFEQESGISPMKFTFRFPFRFAQSSGMDTREVCASGHFPAAVELYANGPIAKPVLELNHKATGELLGRLDLSEISIAQGEQLYYSSRPNHTGVYRLKNGVQTDLVPHLKLENNNFFSIPVDTPCRVSFTAEMKPQGAVVECIAAKPPQSGTPEAPQSSRGVGEGGAIAVSMERNGDVRTVEIPIAQPLYALPELCDELHENGVIRRVGRKILDSQIEFLLVSSENGMSMFLTDIPEAKKERGNFCTNLQEVDVFAGEEGFSLVNGPLLLSIKNNRLGILDSHSYNQKMQAFKNWLGANRVEVLYKLRKEETQQLTEVQAEHVMLGLGTGQTVMSVQNALLRVRYNGSSFEGDRVAVEVAPLNHTMIVHNYFKG